MEFNEMRPFDSWFPKSLAQVDAGETQKEIAERVIEARSRLKKILNNDFGPESEGFVSLDTLKVYGYNTENLYDIGLSTSFKLAISHVASDLLLVEFYNSKGEKTDFAEKNYPNVDPTRYKPLIAEWHQTAEILRKRLIESGWIEAEDVYDDQLLPINTSDITNQYSSFFGEGSIVAIPYRIFVFDNRFRVDYIADFEEPFGGEDNHERIVFVPIDAPNS